MTAKGSKSPAKAELVSTGKSSRQADAEEKKAKEERKRKVDERERLHEAKKARKIERELIVSRNSAMLRCVPLGQDRHRNAYWSFSKEAGLDAMLLRQSPADEWRMYTTEDQLREVSSYMSIYSQPERALKSRLSEAQPSIIAGMALTAGKRGAGASIGVPATPPAALATPSKTAPVAGTPKRTPRAGAAQSPMCAAAERANAAASASAEVVAAAAEAESLAAGSFVMARFGDGHYYPAAVAHPAQGRRVLLDWADGDGSDREVRSRPRFECSPTPAGPCRSRWLLRGDANH